MFDYQRLVACLFGMLARAPGFGPVGKWCNSVSFTFLKTTSIFVQGLFSLPVASWLINLIYPLVNQHNYGKIHHLKWVNQLQKWAMASIANCNSHYQRVHPLVFHCQKAQVVGVTKPPTWQVPGAASSGVHRVVTVCDQHQAVVGCRGPGAWRVKLGIPKNRSVNKRTQGIPKKMEKMDK